VEDILPEPVELTDADLDAVAGGFVAIGSYNVGSFNFNGSFDGNFNGNHSGNGGGLNVSENGNGNGNNNGNIEIG
jgi:hypothetical protein